MSAIGRRHWAISAGWIPARSSGPEPEFSSREILCMLNAGERQADVRIHVVYAGHGPVGPYRLVVAPRRMRRVRINDLIFPEAVRLQEAYGLVLDSDAPIVVQFSRQDTRQRDNAGCLATAWSA
jgi:hypothetical protein